MASLTIRNLDDALKSRLRVEAAKNGRSMAEEARDILRRGLSRQASEPGNLAVSIRARVAALGGFELPVIPREPMREPPSFEE